MPIPERKYGLKHGGKIYLSNDRAVLEDVAFDLRAHWFRGEPHPENLPKLVEAYPDPRLVAILQGDGYEVVDLEAQDA